MRLFDRRSLKEASYGGLDTDALMHVGTVDSAEDELEQEEALRRLLSYAVVAARFDHLASYRGLGGKKRGRASGFMSPLRRAEPLRQK